MCGVDRSRIWGFDGTVTSIANDSFHGRSVLLRRRHDDSRSDDKPFAFLRFEPFWYFKLQLHVPKVFVVPRNYPVPDGVLMSINMLSHGTVIFRLFSIDCDYSQDLQSNRRQQHGRRRRRRNHRVVVIVRIVVVVHIFVDRHRHHCRRLSL